MVEDSGGVGCIGVYFMCLLDEEVLVGKYDIIVLLIEFGDLLVMDYLILYQLGYNVLDRVCWLVQFWFFNYNNMMVVKIGW